MDQAEVHFDVSLVQQLHLRVAENKEVFVEDVTNRRGVEWDITLMYVYIGYNYIYIYHMCI